MWINAVTVVQPPIGETSPCIECMGKPIKVPVAEASSLVTEVFGASGLLIDRVIFGVTSSTGIKPIQYTCGGNNGVHSLHDITPSFNDNGFCHVINIAGTYNPSEDDKLDYLEFLWQCQGR